MILLLDNYDSFVFNLARYFQRLGQSTDVVRSDAIDAQQILHRQPDAVVLSPGPRTPREAGCCLDAVRLLAGRIPILGVCLGHQAIGMAFGAELIRSPQPMHGRTSPILHSREGLFADIASPMTACRYHSLTLDAATLPDCLEVTARTEEGTVMAISHRQHLVLGVQFHPEAILTEYGFELLANFLKLARCVPPGKRRIPRGELACRADLRLSNSPPSPPVTF